MYIISVILHYVRNDVHFKHELALFQRSLYNDLPGVCHTAFFSLCTRANPCTCLMWRCRKQTLEKQTHFCPVTFHPLVSFRDFPLSAVLTSSCWVNYIKLDTVKNSAFDSTAFNSHPLFLWEPHENGWLRWAGNSLFSLYCAGMKIEVSVFVCSVICTSVETHYSFLFSHVCLLPSMF